MKFSLADALERRAGYRISTSYVFSVPVVTVRCLKGGEAEARTQLWLSCGLKALALAFEMCSSQEFRFCFKKWSHTGWPRTCQVAEADPELLILLPVPHKCWDDRHASCLQHFRAQKTH